MATLNEDARKTQAGAFICDTSENLYYGIKHIEQWAEIAQDNRQVLEVVAFYKPLVAGESWKL